MATFKHISLVVILFCLFVFRIVQSDSTGLDNTLKNLALNLFKTFSNQSQLQELINGENVSIEQVNPLQQIPVETISEIYKNYTLEQFNALEAEMLLHKHFIYQPIKSKSKELKADFVVSCESYDHDGNIKQLEQSFVQTGNKLVSLQKLVLRIINSKLVDKLSMANFTKKVNYRTSRVWGFNMFDKLSEALFGVQTTLYKEAPYSPVNKMYILIQELEKIENIPANSNDDTMNRNLNSLKNLLGRLRKIYQLNRIASVPNSYLSTDNINPYSYESMIKLVGLLGTRQAANPLKNPLLGQFRLWMNFFSGGNIFTSLVDPFSQANKNKAKYDRDQIKLLIKFLEANEKRRQDEIERNRLKMSLEKLINKQNLQQQQIDAILKILTNKQTEYTPNTAPASTTLPSIQLPIFTRRPPVRLPPVRLPSTTSPNNVLKQLKTQRKLLNELLQELQKPITGGNSTPNRPILPANSSSIYKPSNKDIVQAQQALMSIMKNITPMINMMAQSGLVSQPKLDRSKIDLLTIVNSINNRELDSDGDDSAKEYEHVERLGEKLRLVLDDIIVEAENN